MAKEQPGRIRPSGWTTHTRGTPPRCTAKDSRCSSWGRRMWDTTATARPKREPHPSKCPRATQRETHWWGRRTQKSPWPPRDWRPPCSEAAMLITASPKKKKKKRIFGVFHPDSPFFLIFPLRWTCCYACRRQLTTRAHRAATATAPVTTTNSWTPRWSRHYDGDSSSLGWRNLCSSRFLVKIWKVLLCKMVHPMEGQFYKGSGILKQSILCFTW